MRHVFACPRVRRAFIQHPPLLATRDPLDHCLLHCRVRNCPHPFGLHSFRAVPRWSATGDDHQYYPRGYRRCSLNGLPSFASPLNAGKICRRRR
ncbi:hypothetical protein GUJ93_ZPchr0013g36007 [Zizania palustris]|uniref:Uncharacterized protein n=1 Tax=Zizania palustris TaxID=103762 RepID=A0A8J6C2K2_ZIZPA|nr:hypothetical protein GUJ93_ZPchr0013g36007 [Zizania palustris]KAG8100691.1 hypothetical protein GUJ93_ZPchr0013g36007 [Zizania palustris]